MGSQGDTLTCWPREGGVTVRLTRTRLLNENSTCTIREKEGRGEAKIGLEFEKIGHAQKCVREMHGTRRVVWKLTSTASLILLSAL